MRTAKRAGAGAIALWLGLGGGCAGTRPELIGELLGAAGLGLRPSLDEPTIVEGLREALRIGTENTVAVTSRVDGFLGNALIRIALPDQLEGTARALRAVGLGAQVDELEVSMNRAAELAAGEATDVFLDAIRGLGFRDARSILEGPETAATDYLRARTGERLRQRFTPIVDGKLREVGLVRLYDGIVSRARALPLVPDPDLDLRAYVTDRGLDGLFTVLGSEERRIREDPEARVTDLLRRVFGS